MTKAWFYLSLLGHLAAMVLIMHAPRLRASARHMVLGLASPLALVSALVGTDASEEDAHDEVLALLGVEPEPEIELGLSDIEVLETSNVYDWVEPAPDPVFET